MVAAPMPGPEVCLESLAMFGFGAIPTIGSALPLNEGVAVETATDQQQKSADGACIVVASPEPESEQSIKKRLRP
ncbi:hypothetical protein CP533_6108, partial [Ophiocordyceps camponoti-saundersi (nom. inval.)]